MLRLWRLVIVSCTVVIGTLTFSSLVTARAQSVEVLHVQGTINPVVSDYVHRGIELSQKTGAAGCIIELDTPGGLDSAMREIVQDILNSEVPVVVYVSPRGARAASAGTFITMAAHVAAMAPETVIGAAHPVSIGASKGTSAVDEKVLNDAAAYIRTLAQTRGRNAEWAEKAVRESVSITESEAMNQGVIDIISPNLEDLLAKLAGRTVTVSAGQVVTLNTAGARIERINMDPGESLLHAIADPNVAYLLLIMAIIGLLVEISSPGLVFPGIVGGICLLLGLYALGVLPVNWAGVLLMLLAFALFIAEAYVSGFGVLGGGGIISLVLGSIILFKGGPLFRVSPWLIGTVVILIAGFLFFALRKVVEAHRRPASTGREELAGQSAVVRKALKPEGMVLFKGELWDAVSESGPVEVGEEVTINRVEGLRVYVNRK
jgi:membrane-bound serine protease (ClpP class)